MDNDRGDDNENVLVHDNNAIVPEETKSSRLRQHDTMTVAVHDEEEYQALRKRYLEKHKKSDFELGGGRVLRNKYKQAIIDTPTPGFKALKKDIAQLERQRNHAAIYSKLKQLMEWEKKPGTTWFPFRGKRKDNEVAEVIDLFDSDNEEETEKIDVDRFIIDVLLVKVVKPDPDAEEDDGPSPPPAKKLCWVKVEENAGQNQGKDTEPTASDDSQSKSRTLHNQPSSKTNQSASANKRRPMDKNHPEYIATLENMADVYSKQGQYTLAMKLTQKAASIRGKKYAVALHNLASVHEKQAQYSEAMDMYKQALVIKDQTWGKDHPEYANTLHSMADVHNEQGRYTEAMELYEQALVIKGSALGEDHPLYAATLQAMAQVHVNQVQSTKALELYQQALAIQGSALGNDHPDYAATLHGMAQVHFEQGQYDDAMGLYQQALAIAGSASGKDHPHYAATLHGMAQVHFEQGQYDEAMELYQQALMITGNALGKDHPEYAATLHDMGTVKYKQGNLEQSMNLLQQAHDIWTKVHSGNDQHPDIVSAKTWIANVQRELEQQE